MTQPEYTDRAFWNSVLDSLQESTESFKKIGCIEAALGMQAIRKAILTARIAKYPKEQGHDAA